MHVLRVNTNTQYLSLLTYAYVKNNCARQPMLLLCGSIGFLYVFVRANIHPCQVMSECTLTRSISPCSPFVFAPPHPRPEPQLTYFYFCTTYYFLNYKKGTIGQTDINSIHQILYFFRLPFRFQFVSTFLIFTIFPRKKIESCFFLSDLVLCT